MASRKRSKRDRLQAEQDDDALAEVDRLAERIARAWRSPKSAVELLEEQRHERYLALIGGSRPPDS